MMGLSMALEPEPMDVEENEKLSSPAKGVCFCPKVQEVVSEEYEP
jgi:hypothetical protein